MITFFANGLKSKRDYAIKKGIRSFSAYVTFRLAQLMTEDKKLAKVNRSPAPLQV